MKTIFTFCVAFLLVAGLAFAAGIDGTWVSQRTMGDRTITQTFELKADGAKITGSITMAFGDMEPRKAQITEGKLDGNKFSFTANMPGRDGEVKTVFTGTIEGDMLKGNSVREGGQDRPFEAKKK